MKVSDKYTAFGGISYFLDEFKAGKLSLEKIGVIVKCSRETVRNDFKKEVGDKGYRLIVLEKENLKQVKTQKKYFPIDEMINFLREDTFSPGEKNRKSILDHVQKSLPFDFMVRVQKNEIKLFVSDMKIIVRHVEIKEGTHDHKTNYCRFKITNSINNYNYAIFVTIYKGEYNYYVFKTLEIARLKSLALRYREPQKPYKYREALENWGLFKDEGV